MCQLAKTGVLATLRCFFAKNRDDERYSDFSPAGTNESSRDDSPLGVER